MHLKLEEVFDLQKTSKFSFFVDQHLLNLSLKSSFFAPFLSITMSVLPATLTD